MSPETACRTVLSDMSSSRGVTNAGMVLDRYLEIPQGSGETSDKRSADAKKRLLEQSIRASANDIGLYSKAYERWQASLPGNTCPPRTASGAVQPLHVNGRVVVGMGNDNVIEAGLTLNHTYGTPFIPGSALKGLAAHYCDCVWGGRPFDSEAAGDDPSEEQLKFRRCREGEPRNKVGDYHRILFGTTKDAGHLIFHDAWITPESLTGRTTGLVMDVMTPHHKGYYTGEQSDDDRTPPTDFDDPTPLPFLSASGRFCIAISCEDASGNGQAWLQLGWQVLTEALENWGVGGKTSSGYGRLTSDQT